MLPDTFVGGVLCSFKVTTLMQGTLGDNSSDIKFLGAPVYLSG